MTWWWWSARSCSSCVVDVYSCGALTTRLFFAVSFVGRARLPNLGGFRSRVLLQQDATHVFR